MSEGLQVSRQQRRVRQGMRVVDGSRLEWAGLQNCAGKLSGLKLELGLALRSSSKALHLRHGRLQVGGKQRRVRQRLRGRVAGRPHAAVQHQRAERQRLRRRPVHPRGPVRHHCPALPIPALNAPHHALVRICQHRK